eukprot:970237_1
MQSGGIKESSHSTYVNNFAEFWRTMRRLKISDKLTWTLPTPDILLRVYIVDCARVRPHPNVWGTIRNKLRSIDYISQLTGCIQSWHENPAIAAQVLHCKKQNVSTRETTLPITATKLWEITVYVLRNKVYNGLILTKAQQRLRQQGLIFSEIWESPHRLAWYVMCLSWVINGTLGLRGAEQYKHHKPEYREYGLHRHHVIFFQKLAHGRYKRLPNRDINTDLIDHARIEITNAKIGTANRSVFLRLGRTRRDFDPLIMLYRLMRIQTKYLKQKSPFIFDTDHHSITLASMKKVWSSILKEMQWLEWWRYR